MSKDYKLELLENDGAEISASAANYLSEICHGLSKQAGWWDGVNVDDPNVRAAKLCLVHSEVSEALEGMRKGINDDHLIDRKMEEVELADAVIRIFDYAGAAGFDIGGALAEKLTYNCNRADHKKENREKDGGKKI